MRYGKFPEAISVIENNGSFDEMCFYQYMPIKDRGGIKLLVPDHVDSDFLFDIINASFRDFIILRGEKELRENYVYLTMKHLYVTNGKVLNRPGVHSDGFMTEDINYIWSNALPTVFYIGDFGEVPMCDKESLVYFENNKHKMLEANFKNNTLLRLDQYNVHETNTTDHYEGMRLFVKISFSKDKYDLKGNAKNPDITSNWEYRDREITRNIPQKL